MTGLRVLIVLAVIWLLVVLLFRWAALPILRAGPGRAPVMGMLWYASRALCRVVHRPVYEGEELIRRQIEPGGLVVVSNHTGSIDPFLIQSACRFQLRWMMAEEQMFPALDLLWRYMRFIPVARDGTDTGPAREAIRHVKAGGVIGLFPEGRIVTPPRQVWPFFAGVGLIAARTRAPVLLVWISGTPETNKVSESILTPSRARVRFLELIDFEGERDAKRITEILRQKLHEATGWPLNDDPPPPNTAAAPDTELPSGTAATASSAAAS